MGLPKTDTALFELTIPSTKAKVSFRKMKYKEEKLYLMAKESRDLSEILRSIKQVVNNCMMSTCDVDQLALFDLENLYLKLRSASVDNIAKVAYKDSQDEKVYDFSIDLDKIEVIFPENVDKMIKVSDSISIELGYPTASLYSDKELLESMKTDKFFDHILAKCVKRVFEGDKMYNLSEFTTSEVEDFFDNLDIKVVDKIKNFFNNLPKMEHVIEYENSLGNKRKIVLSTLDDFFILV